MLNGLYSAASGMLASTSTSVSRMSMVPRIDIPNVRNE